MLINKNIASTVTIIAADFELNTPKSCFKGFAYDMKLSNRKIIRNKKITPGINIYDYHYNCSFFSVHVDTLAYVNII